MKKIISLLLTTLFLSFTAFSQPGQGQHKTPEERAKMTVDEVTKSVTLTAKQKTDMTTIFTKFYTDVREQHAFREPDKLALFEKDRDTKVEKMLNNKTTYKKYQEAMVAMKKKWEEQRKQ